MYCIKCGYNNEDQARFCASCGTPLDSSSNEAVSMQDISSLSPISKGYAGFWIRFAAGFIDWVLGGIVIGVLSIFIPYLGSLLGLLSWWLYYALMESSPYQATIGKLATSIIVTDMDGKRITFWRATGRFFSKVLLVILIIPYIISCIAIAFTSKKQAFHDMIAGCLVLNK